MQKTKKIRYEEAFFDPRVAASMRSIQKHSSREWLWFEVRLADIVVHKYHESF